MKLARRPLALILTAPLFFLGCDGGDGGGEDHAEEGHEEHHEESGDEHGSATEGHGDGDGDELGHCDTEERADEFAIGLSKTGELVKATFVSANPAPPIKGDNTWVLNFTDLSGEPLEGLSITVIPTMPDHGHGTPVATIVAPSEVPGQYEFSFVNLFMTGLWEINFELTLANAEQETLMFGFCVE